MISIGILFAFGVDGLISKIGGRDRLILFWYTPFSIIITGILCALPTLIFNSESELSRSAFRIRIILHFLILFAVVSLAGYLFNWYDDVRDYLFVMGSYFMIYILVWIGSILLRRYDENLINQALQQIQDDE